MRSLLSFFALLVFVTPRLVAAQAYIPPKGEGTVSASFQSVHTSGQLNSTGDELGPDKTDTRALIWHVEYGLTKKLAVHASLPFMFVKYEGPVPHSFDRDRQPSNLDDGTYHGNFQDFYFGARYGVIQSPRFALAPFVEVILPSHDYEYTGQAVVGRDLRAVLVGAAVGGFLDDVAPGLHFQTRISYAMTEKVFGIRPNRTGIDTAVGYFITPRLAVQFVETFQFYHAGLDFVGPNPAFVLSNGERTTIDHIFSHDRLLRTRVLNFGGGATYAFNESLGVFGTFTTMAWGRNIQRPERAFTMGVNWSFKTPLSERP